MLMAKKLVFNDLQVPSFPSYDWDLPPDQQPEYVNPVTLNNCVIRWANASLLVAQALVNVNKRIAKAKVEVQRAKDALDDFEQDLMRTYPPPAQATKSLKLTNAYLDRVAGEAGRRDAYAVLVKAARDRQAEFTLLEVEADNCRFVWQTLKMAGDHAMTHLSFVKAEAEYSKKGL